MEAEQVIMIRAIINESYPYVKMDKAEGDEVWFLMLQDYSYEIIISVLKGYIKNGNKFAPSIAELIKLHDQRKESFRHPLVDFMLDQGYFDDRDKDGNKLYGELPSFNRDNRVRKHNMWLLEDRVPEVFKKDLEKYRKLMEKEELKYTERKMIG